MERQCRWKDRFQVTYLEGQKLRYVDINWQLAVKGAYKSMAPGARFNINAWTETKAEVNVMIKAFEDAGFKEKNAFLYKGSLSASRPGVGCFVTGVR